MDKGNLTFLVVGIMIAFLFFAGASAFLSSPVKVIQTPSKTGNVVLTQPVKNAGDMQIINLSAQGINYTPSEFTVNANHPVKIVANVPTLQGCLRSFTIPQLGIKKVFSDSDNSVEFTPTKKGTFDFSCFMGMGRGKITVI